MTLHELERRYPEWRPFLADLGRVLVELQDRRWDRAVPEAHSAAGDVPRAFAAGLDPAEAPMPLLHALRRRCGPQIAWSQGYCPVCGAWPAFAEVCGVERNRYLRCARCGASWRTHPLNCPYCRLSEHEALGTLVVEQGGPQRAIDVCGACKGYLKVLTTLSPCAPEQVLLEDLATAELDLAAEARGYRRPEGAGYAPA